MNKLQIHNIDFISIKEVEEMEQNWFVKKGKYFTCHLHVITAAYIANEENARLMSKSDMIELLEMKANQSGVVAIPL